MRSIKLFLFLFITFVASSQQQMGSFMAYGPEAGCFSGINFSVYQSKNGYLWIGTPNGIVRFDGKHYKSYFSDYSDNNSPSDNTIVDIAEDKNGELWFAGFTHGATKYNQRSGKFTKYPALSRDNFPMYCIYSIMKDVAGDMWFATGGRGIAKYIYEKDSFLLYYPEPDKCKDGSVRGDNYVTDLAEDKFDKNILWCATFKGLFSFNKQTKEFIKYNAGLPAGAADLLINTIELDNDGNVWAGCWATGLQYFNTKTKAFEKSKARSFPTVVYDLKKVNDSIIYAACMNDGLYALDPRNNLFTNITPPRNPADPTINKLDIQRVSLTPSAGIFVGGNYYIYQQHPDYMRLKKNVLYPGLAKGDPGVFLKGCLWDEKRRQYIITTLGGKGIYTISSDLQQVKPVTSTVPTIEEAYFHDLALDALGRVWMLNRERNLCQWNTVKGSVDIVRERLPVPDSLLQKIWRLSTDKEGNLWMMSGEQFICWNVKDNTTEIIPLQWDAGYAGPHNIRQAEMKFDPDGNPWLISHSGLFQCKRKEKKVYQFYKTGNRLSDLSSVSLISGVFNKYKNFWITAGNGIQVYDWQADTVKANHNLFWGLPAMQVNSLAADSSGMIWAGSVTGIMRFDPTKKIWQLFNRLDGMERDYLDGDMYVTSNNKLVIDQQNGLLLKDVNEIGSGSAVPILRVTTILINNKEYKDSLLPEYINRLELGYDENNIDIEFAAMDWLYPFKTNYRYRVDGLTTGPGMLPNTDGRISMSGLQPGKYTVHVRALSSNGLLSNEISFIIVIRPPYWKTGWFVLLCVAVVVMIGWLLYRYRIRQLKRTYEMRSGIARELHDEIGSTLSNINILNELAKRNQENPAKSGEYLDKAGEDIQRISESLGDIVWNINPRYDDLQNLFVRMKRYASDMMDGKNISYEMSFPENANNLSLSMGRRRDFYLIFKEAINNLVKYSKATTAKVIIETEGKKLRMTINDNGIGFDSSQPQYGNGISNMRQRAGTWKDQLEIKSVPGKGTEVVLEMNTG
jgi:ligand-binding sensor domain-containing protein/two-component sensor histidine kinase